MLSALELRDLDVNQWKTLDGAEVDRGPATSVSLEASTNSVAVPSRSHPRLRMNLAAAAGWPATMTVSTPRGRRIRDIGEAANTGISRLCHRHLTGRLRHGCPDHA